MILEFVYKDTNISFKLIYSNRKTSEIRIKPPDNIIVRAPSGVGKEEIIDMVRKKADWILEKLTFYKDIKYKVVEKEFVSGEDFLLLGKYYPLKLEKNPGSNKIDISLTDDNIVIKTNTADKDKLKASMGKWYRKMGLEFIKKRAEYYKKFFEITPKSIRVKEQKTRWGSCTSKDELLFNWRMIMAPVESLDYVIVHEMCHMVEKNHSKDFWNLVEEILPDWKARKDWLKKMDLI